jgi:hypothetical protein
MNFSDFGMIKAQSEAGDPMFAAAYSGMLTEQERYLIHSERSEESQASVMSLRSFASLRMTTCANTFDAT